MRRLVYILIIFFIVTSCIEEYIQANISQDQKKVVIQGRIFAGEESVFYVSYTKDFGDRNKLQETILNATVKIVGENGYESKKAEFDIENDRYFIDTKDLEANTLYAVRVEVEGETYQSEYLSILQTPEIEEITYEESPNGISLLVSTKGDNDGSRYYMWSYEEDWEFTASIDFKAEPEKYYYNEFTYPIGENQPNPYYRCWGHNLSSNIYLGSTDKLNENIIKNLKLFTISADDVRISNVYSLLLKQWTLSKEAYAYYTQMQQLTEKNDGIFQLMPYEIKGNVHCISTPSKKTLGYVIASNITTKRKFIFASDFKQCIPVFTGICSETSITKENFDWQTIENELRGGAIFYIPTKINFNHFWEYTPTGKEIIYSKQCVDCRTVEGSTNKRPDFWPIINE